MEILLLSRGTWVSNYFEQCERFLAAGTRELTPWLAINRLIPIKSGFLLILRFRLEIERAIALFRIFRIRNRKVKFLD